MVPMNLNRLSGAIDALVVADPGELAEPDTIYELRCQLDRLRAVSTRATNYVHLPGPFR